MSPVRTCIACRGKELKKDLLRVAFNGGFLVDSDKKLSGRGAYFHASCLKKVLLKEFGEEFLLEFDSCLADSAGNDSTDSFRINKKFSMAKSLRHAFKLKSNPRSELYRDLKEGLF